MLFEFNFEFMEGNVAKGPPAISRALAQPVGFLLKTIGWKYRQPDRGALMGGCELEDLA
jgi:hypothetical protein